MGNLNIQTFYAKGQFEIVPVDCAVWNVLNLLLVELKGSHPHGQQDGLLLRAAIISLNLLIVKSLYGGFGYCDLP